MAYRITGEGYSAFFREQEDGRDAYTDDGDDAYTCLLCNTSYEKDLQLAAELGKTLLERNKELEAALRQHQNIVEDQAQEIEYLRKQTAALREVNDSRLRIYEQLEVSIQELEHNNHRLATQAASDKKHITSLESQVEKLDGKCEELQKKLDEREEAKEVKRQGEEETLEVAHLKEEIVELRTGNAKQVAKVKDLQATIDTVTQENLKLEEQVLVLQKQIEESSVVSEHVRCIEVCSRCLRSLEEPSLTEGDEDDISVIDSLINDDNYQSLLLKESMKELCSKGNPYRELVEKYEALVNVQRSPGVLKPHKQENKCMSLQEELQLSGDFAIFRREEDVDSETDIQPAKPQSTPTDFSEAETSSSGFSDETISKATQTEALAPPGSFLCSISDGDDCKFSIYNEASPIEARFRKIPEYKKLFREIFVVLKRAAEAKDEGENLPLLEDLTPMCEQPPKVPPVTPSVEEPPDFPQAEPMNKGHPGQQQVEAAPPAAAPSAPPSAEPPAPKQRPDIFEHLYQGLGGKKHKSRRHRSSVVLVEPQTGGGGGASGGGVVPVVRSSKKKKEFRRGGRGGSVGSDSGRSTPDVSKRATWCGEVPIPSAASQGVAQLKQIDESYANVLRFGRRK